MIEILKNQTEKHEFTITNSEGAVDLTGSTARLVIEKRDGTEVHSQEKTSFSAPTTGVVVFTIDRATTAAFEVGAVKVQIDILNTSDERDYSEIYSGKIIDTLKT